mmetsp:Transcript_700/g.1530  ORF Transcript_700/g.1530 Transcript_700/m.1530 type:complete len:225 (+) Transcript_700:198-872(+)
MIQHSCNMICVCKYKYIQINEPFFDPNNNHTRPFLFLGKQNFLEMFPHDREQNTLQPIRQNLSLQPPEHQSLYAALLNHIPHHLRITQCHLRTLLVYLNHPNTITARIAHGRRAEAHDGTSPEFFERIILLWDFFGEEVVGEKPGVVSHEGGGGGGEGAVVEGGDAFHFYFADDIGEFAGYLHCGFDCIHRHQKDTKQSRSGTRRHSLIPDIQIFRRIHGIHQR